MIIMVSLRLFNPKSSRILVTHAGLRYNHPLLLARDLFILTR